MNIIQDIINLKKKHHLLEDDATDEKQRQWYNFAVSKGLVLTVYDNDRLVGFLEYVRLTNIPKTLDDLVKLATGFVIGKILFVGNCISESPKILRQLKRELFRCNHDHLYLVWHKKKTGIMKIYKNIRRRNESSLA